jgi:UDP-N-acetylglucosamine 2-epimerase
MSQAQNPYGDGKAAKRIVGVISRLINRSNQELFLQIEESAV